MTCSCMRSSEKPEKARIRKSHSGVIDCMRSDCKGENSGFGSHLASMELIPFRVSGLVIVNCGAVNELNESALKISVV